MQSPHRPSNNSTGPNQETDEDEDEDEDEEGPSSELAEAEMKQMASLKCCRCQKALLSQRRDGSGVRVCDGCHRCFHTACVGRKGAKGKKDLSSSEEGEDDVELWFHSDECKAFHTRLTTLHGYNGSMNVKNNASQLRMFSPEKTKKEIASKAEEKEEKEEQEEEEEEGEFFQGIQHASSVLSDGFGPLVGGAVLASDFVAVLYNDNERLAALENAADAMMATAERQARKQTPNDQSHSSISPLNKEGNELISPSELSQMLKEGNGIEPISFFDEADAQLLSSGPYAIGAVSAATIDVLGQDLAMMDLLATRDDVRGRGHAKVLVDSLESALASVGVQSLLVAVSGSDQATQEAWAGGRKGKGTIGIGYKKLSKGERQKLSTQWPHFSAVSGSEHDGPIYFKKQLKKVK